MHAGGNGARIIGHDAQSERRVAREVGMTVVRALLSVFLVVIPAGAARAGWFEIGVSNDAANAEGGAHLGAEPDGGFALGGRLLYDDDTDTTLGAFVFRFEGALDASRSLEFGVGGQAFLGEADDRDVGAVALGAEVTWVPPRARGFFGRARIYWAPGILSWGDTDSAVEWGVRAGIRFTPRVNAFVDYRHLEADFDDAGDRTLSEGLTLGFAGRF